MTYVVIGIVAVLVLAAAYVSPVRFLGVSPDGEYAVTVTVGEHELTATMENTRASHAFKRLLRAGPRTVRMRDYGSMEKVGVLWQFLPARNAPTAVVPGDIVLYMGGSLVVYYEPHTWDFTRLGHIDADPDTLRRILGAGGVEMTFALAGHEH